MKEAVIRKGVSTSENLHVVRRMVVGPGSACAELPARARDAPGGSLAVPFG